MADVFVSASKTEAQGLTYFEALILGLPALCKEDPCLKDVIINGYNGFLYKDFKSFTTYLDALMADDQKRIEMSKNAFLHGQKYTAGKFTTAIEGLYKEIINSRHDKR